MQDKLHEPEILDDHARSGIAFFIGRSDRGY